MSVIIPQTDPRANYRAHRAEIDAAIAAVLQGGRYILGEQVTSFEHEFAAYLGVRHAIGVGSGTDALHLALRACGIGPGLPVFTVAHTAVATVAAVEMCGATPVLVDINPADLTMDPQRLEEMVKASRGEAFLPAPAVTKDVAPDAGIPDAARSPGNPTGTLRGASPLQGTPFRGAIIPVHLYGQPADTAAILALARRYDLALVEDCAQSHGATDNGQMTGAIGDIAAFSFYPTKNLGALGDGGAVATRSAGLAERVRLLREYGWRERYVSDIPGFNSRLDELQAAILRVKLRHLDAENARRSSIAAEYDRLLAGSGLALPRIRPGAMHVYHQYVVRAANRDGLQSHLRTLGIGALIHYPVPVHLQPAYAGRLPGADALPETEAAARQVLSLPMFPELTDEQVWITAAAVVGWAAEAL
jgi:dTDP-4-amino-4,6-dideoxygalactose transaminase